MECVFCNATLEEEGFCPTCLRAGCDSVASAVETFADQDEALRWIISRATRQNQNAIKAYLDRAISDPLARNRWRNLLRDTVNAQILAVQVRPTFSPHAESEDDDACEFNPTTVGKKPPEVKKPPQPAPEVVQPKIPEDKPNSEYERRRREVEEARRKRIAEMRDIVEQRRQSMSSDQSPYSSSSQSQPSPKYTDPAYGMSMGLVVVMVIFSLFFFIAILSFIGAIITAATRVTSLVDVSVVLTGVLKRLF